MAVGVAPGQQHSGYIIDEQRKQQQQQQKDDGGGAQKAATATTASRDANREIANNERPPGDAGEFKADS